MLQLDTTTGIISDLDGVMYRGDEPIPEAIAAVNGWQSRGIPVVYVTNNSTRTASEFAQKLTELGVATTAENVITTSAVTGEVIQNRFSPDIEVYVIGAQALVQAIKAAGFRIGSNKPEVVVIGLDKNVTYSKLRIAVRSVLAGATLIGTNPDLLLPSDDGFDPGAGCLLEACTCVFRNSESRDCRKAGNVSD